MAHDDLVPYEEIDVLQCTACVGVCRDVASAFGCYKNGNLEHGMSGASTVE